MYLLVLSAGARADLKRLDRNVAARILVTLERFASTGHGDFKALRGHPDEFRLRAGDWRVRMSLEGNTLTVLRVLHRREAYR